MKLPRDIGGYALASLLAKYGYQTMHQTGSHIRLVSLIKNRQHCITIPAHKTLKVGTLSGILKDVASYLEIDFLKLCKELFD
ncbi:MAG: type II toxin-antitoxin system HicA family toxin [Thermodesulfovibrionales bacterium]|nr:type II toxin-antitoxin system HicA family toxin [Thermodesulfovibrionales bacterium]